MTHTNRVPGSFRDPSGFMFVEKGILYRRVNASYLEEYSFLINSGLYKELVDSSQLISHIEVESTDTSFRILQPERIANFSYPYEWSFSQLKDAALLTLDIQEKAILKGMILKDASAYNVTFNNGRVIFLDTLSFDKYVEGRPWIAYRQFCQHFLAPLALMSKKDIRLNSLIKSYIDGIPLDIASSLLPLSSYLNLGLFLHIHIHAKSQKKHSGELSSKRAKHMKISRKSMLAMIAGLKSTIRNLKWAPGGTEWDDYYSSNNNYNHTSMLDKEQKVNLLLSSIKPDSVWDLGANFGNFSRVASDHSKSVVAWDIDPSCVERNYLSLKKHEYNITPLLMDLTNPSPSIGWDCNERQSFFDRGRPSILLALGLVHHLAISNNIPLSNMFESFARLSDKLIIEFVPKSDSQVQKLLSSREDIFENYSKEGFEDAFLNIYELRSLEKIKDSERSLYYLEKI